MEMEKILSLDEMPLKEELRDLLCKNYDNVQIDKGYLYAEGEIPVLLIAHLDTVHKNLAPPICWSKDGRFIVSPNGVGGDDRCGVYMILEIIKELKCHVLFCEQEEVGCVGAKAFCKSDIKPDVNYIIEFDRKGSEDSVFYDCDNSKFETFVNSVGFKTAWGSCSDISYVAPHLEVAAVNLSSGYYNPHTLYEFIDMYFVNRNVKWAKELILKDSATRYPYIKKTYGYYNTGKTYGKGTTTGAVGKKTDTTTTGTTAVTKKDEKVKTEKNVIISRLLMRLDPAKYWIYESEWNDCPRSAEYYIDSKLDTYIEYNGIFEAIPGLNVYSKETLYPPEFVAKNSKLCDINFDENVF